MKKLICFMFVMLSVAISFVHSQTVSDLDEKYGFRDAKFEMPKSSFKNLVEVEKNFYRRTNDNLTLGDYKLSYIYYYFFNGYLTFINIKTKGYINSTGVLKILQSAYGDGDKENKYIEKYKWMGSKVRMSYEQNSITDNADIMILSVKMAEQMQSYENDRNSNAGKGL